MKCRNPEWRADFGLAILQPVRRRRLPLRQFLFPTPRHVPKQATQHSSIRRSVPLANASILNGRGDGGGSASSIEESGSSVLKLPDRNPPQRRACAGPFACAPHTARIEPTPSRRSHSTQSPSVLIKPGLAIATRPDALATTAPPMRRTSQFRPEGTPVTQDPPLVPPDQTLQKPDAPAIPACLPHPPSPQGVPQVMPQRGNLAIFAAKPLGEPVRRDQTILERLREFRRGWPERLCHFWFRPARARAGNRVPITSPRPADGLSP